MGVGGWGWVFVKIKDLLKANQYVAKTLTIWVKLGMKIWLKTENLREIMKFWVKFIKSERKRDRER